jgi:hypothetical protein
VAKTIPPGFESLFLCQYTVSMAGVAEWFKVAPCEGGCRVRPTSGSPDQRFESAPRPQINADSLSWVWVVSVACCLTVLTTW